jgi:hypothetical protein
MIGEEMTKTKTMWSIFWITLRITYLAGFLPYLMLFILIQNSIRKSRNSELVVRELKKYNVPKDLRKELKKSFSNTLSLDKMLKFANLERNRSKEHKEKNKGLTIKLGDSSNK